MNLQKHGGTGDIPSEGNINKPGRWEIVKLRASIIPKIILLIFTQRMEYISKKALTLTCFVSSKLVIGIPIYLVPKRIQNII